MLGVGQTDGVGDFLGDDVVMLFLVVELVDEIAHVNRLSVHEHVEIVLFAGRAEQDVDHGLHDVDVLVGPLGEHGNIGQGVTVDGGIERTGHLPLAVLVDHGGELVAQLAQILFARPLPARPSLVGVHVHGKADHAGGGQFPDEFRGQGLAVGIDDGFPALGDHIAHERNEIGINKGLATGDGDAVGAPQLLDGLQVLDDHVQGLMAERVVFAVTTLAVQVALGGGFEPGDGIVSQVPRKAIIRFRGQRSFSHGAPVRRREFKSACDTTRRWVIANGRFWQPAGLGLRT